jgi:ABC-type bacteriocin/lantibiotic exporter with double-glycine peptidase domain
MSKFPQVSVFILICVTIGIVLGLFAVSEKKTVIQQGVSGQGRMNACGPLCLRIASNLYGISCDELQAFNLCLPEQNGTRLSNLKKAAPKLGMKARITSLRWDELKKMQNMAILINCWSCFLRLILAKFTRTAIMRITNGSIQIDLLYQRKTHRR